MNNLLTAVSLSIALTLPLNSLQAASSIGISEQVAQPNPGLTQSQTEKRLSAADTVTWFHDNLIDVMKQAGRLGAKDRYATLTPTIDHAFHLDLTAKQAAGRRPWNAASVAEREAMQAAFRHWTISTYAQQFDGYSGQSFKTTGEKPGPRDGMVLVETQFSIPNEAPVKFTYLMINTDGRWGVYDVLVKRGSTSISQLAKHISEFKSIVRDGLPALTATLNGKARELLGD